MVSTKVLMVFPRFNPNSFWSLRATCEVYGARHVAPPLGLITVAALLPKHWTVRLIDRNVQSLQDADLDWADMIMTGGMLPQRPDAEAVIALAQAHGKPVVVGGPDATSCPDAYEAADFLVLGEAEGILDAFVAAWDKGERRGRLTAEKFKVDVTMTPVPRFDLIKDRGYLYVGVQFSRGCPFNCEFCDIIELYGRMPRSKGIDQMLAELQTLYDIGYRGQVDFVDDNLIGNKKALKQFLPALERWQVEHGYPFFFSTEASINLADDAQLLDMLGRANFFAVFIGIESPDTATLVHTRKKQNTRRSLADSVARINAAGLFVLAGFIVGFDTEGDGVAEAMIDCIEATAIPTCTVGLLTALPGTQLHRRLEREGRLLELDTTKGDHCTAGLNFVPSRPRRDILEDYRRVVSTVYRPEAFFDRVLTASLRMKRGAHMPAGGKLPDRQMLAVLIKVVLRMTFVIKGGRRPFWRALRAVSRRNPQALHAALTQTALYLHLGPFADFVVGEIDRQIAALPEEERRLAAE